MAKILGLKQLRQKKYEFLENLPEDFEASFGKLVKNFTMTLWGNSSNGKSTMNVEFLKVIMNYGKVLYVALEEGHEATTQINFASLSDDYNGKIEFADHTMTFDELWKKLDKKKSPPFVVIDSIQYWEGFTWEKYKKFKEHFVNKKKKGIVFVSHAEGKEPAGTLAKRIRYDTGLKVFVKGFIAFVGSRYRNRKNFVVWEEGARREWGKDFDKMILKVVEVKEKKKKPTTKKPKNEKAQLPEDKPLEKPGQLVLGEQHVQREGEAVLPEMVKQSA
jgi:hypothetical protein